MQTTIFRHAVVAAVSVAALLCPAPGAAQPNVDWDAVEITVHHVAGGVHYLEGRGGNIGLSIGDDGVVMMTTRSS